MSSDLLSLAVVAAILLTPLLIFNRSRQYERTLSLIARGVADHAGDVGRVSSALNDPRNRQRLAAALARALDRAEHWESLPVAARPPGSVRNLALFRGEIEEIISLAKTATAAGAGLALLELSLLGGYASPVYASDPRTLRELLWRTRYLLATGVSDRSLQIAPRRNPPPAGQPLRHAAIGTAQTSPATERALTKSPR